MKRAFNRNPPGLYRHFSIIAVFPVHPIEVVEERLINRNLVFDLLRKLLHVVLQVNIGFETALVWIERSAARNSVMRIKFVKRVRIELVAPVH